MYVGWLCSSRDLSRHTVRAYEYDLVILGRYLGPDMQLSAMTTTHLHSFFAEQRRNGLMPASLRRRAAGVRGFCSWAESQGWVDHDLWAGTALSFRGTRSLPRSVTRHDLERLLDHLTTAAAIPDTVDPEADLIQIVEVTTLLAVTLMVSTGLRVGELVALHVDDVDIQDRSVLVLGKGRKERIVFLTNDWLCDVLSAYIGSRAVRQVSHEYLLFGRDGQPLTTEAVRARIRRAGELTGLSRRITPHMLRHSAATQLVESGVDIRFVQRLLGHASLSTTEIYTHVSNQALRRAVTAADVLSARVADQ